MRKNPEIKMVALDLDGTALTPDRHFSPRTKDAFAKAMAQGVHVVIATGRTLQSLPEEIYHIPGLEYGITSNGARILHLHDRRVIFESLLTPDAVRAVIAVAQERGIRAEGFTQGHAYIDQKEFDGVQNGTITTRDRAYVMATRNPVPDIFAFLEDHCHSIENISLNYDSDAQKGETEAVLAQIPGITLTSSFPLNNEVGGADTSKANSLRILCQQLGLTENQLMAVGDSHNDLAMIRLAAVGVAMGNAEEAVKAEADHVTLSNAEDGVALAMERFVLGK